MIPCGLDEAIFHLLLNNKLKMVNQATEIITIENGSRGDLTARSHITTPSLKAESIKV